MPYKFEKDELLKLLIRAYDEGNCGFLDLSGSVAEKLVEENKHRYEENVDHTYATFSLTGPELFAARNLSAETVHLDTVRIDTDNLIVSHSNQMEGTRWEPYAETYLIRKETENGQIIR